MWIAATFFVVGLVRTALAAAPVLPADTILSNGHIYTGDGWAQALAIDRGVIIDVGEDGAIMQHARAGTRVIDLRNETVMPGLYDMHVHPMGAGSLHTACRFAQGLPPARIADAVRGCVARHKPGAWITGGQWDAASFGQVPVNRVLLDRVSPNNPVALMDISVHALWLNSRALELVGITRATPNPPGGIIERDAHGEPTGVVRESARALVQAAIPAATPTENVADLKWALGEMLSYGITSLTDAGIDENGLSAYATLADEGLLKQRVLGCIGWHPEPFATGDTAIEAAIRDRNLYARPRFRPECIKVFLDGVPTEGHTAAMLKPYADASRSDPARVRGMLMVPQTLLNAAVTRFDRMGLTVKFHAAGDAAVRAALDSIEAARKANGFSGLLHNVGHNSFVAMSDIERARSLAATFEMSPYIWYPNPIIPDIQKAIGAERMQRWIPVKDAIDSGALVVPGSDWAVVPSVNPWIAIEALVTRQRPGGGGEILGAQERITLKQAIDLFTINAAREMGTGDKTGRIARGWLADLLVLDRDPFAVPITQVHDTHVRAVMINGEIVLRNGFPL